MWYKHAGSCDIWEKRNKNTSRRRALFSFSKFWGFLFWLLIFEYYSWTHAISHCKCLFLFCFSCYFCPIKEQKVASSCQETMKYLIMKNPRKDLTTPRSCFLSFTSVRPPTPCICTTADPQSPKCLDASSNWKWAIVKNSQTKNQKLKIAVGVNKKKIYNRTK